MPLPRIRRLIAVLPLLAVSACAFTGIDLVQDKRISLVTPHDGDKVSLPFTVHWNVNKAIAPGHEVSYAVFVDRTPIKSGQTLRAVIPSGDTQCQRDPACPDKAYLARHDVYLVDGPSAVIPRVDASDSAHTTHRVIVVVLVDGKRDGEGAWAANVFITGGSS